MTATFSKLNLSFNIDIYGKTSTKQTHRVSILEWGKYAILLITTIKKIIFFLFPSVYHC